MGIKNIIGKIWLNTNLADNCMDVTTKRVTCSVAK